MENPEESSDKETALSDDERAYIRRMLERLMELGIGAVYGEEDDTEEVLIDCEERKTSCRAICCSLVFALTKEEVQRGTIKWDPKKPYFLARDDDGYCSHLDRESLRCNIWEERPKNCRKYDCRKDPQVWTDWEGKVINVEAFKHLTR